MEFEQCRFISLDGVEDADIGGIAAYKEVGPERKLLGVICGCCGRWIPRSRVKIMEEYEWVNIGNVILENDESDEWDEEENEDWE